MSQVPTQSQGRATDSQAKAGQQNAGKKAEDVKSEAAQQLNQGKQGAAETAESLKQQGKHVAAEAKEQMHRAADDVRAAAGEGVHQAKAQTVQMLERQKSNAASSIASIQDALQSASKTLRDEQNPSAAGVADTAAQQLGHISRYIDERPLDDLLADAEDMTRRRPEVVLGGLFVAGLAAARFLKASSRGPRAGQRRAQVIKHPEAYHV